MELWIGALNLGFLYAFMTMGVFFTFRIHDFPDITVDGSFTSGAAAAAVILAGGGSPLLALLAACIIGGAAGAITAYINTRFNVNGLLAGILVMTGLYSVNLRIMGRSNIPLLNQETVFTCLEKINPGLHAEIWICIILAAAMALFWLITALFLKTDLGIAMRATGNNPVMASANGINVGFMTIFGIAAANGMVGISGALVAQYQGFADIGMGIGMIVIGLASVIIGESVLRFTSVAAKVASVIIGSIVFRLIIACALSAGMDPIDMKLLTAVFVFATLAATKYLAGRRRIDLSNIMAAVKQVPPQTIGGILISFCIVFGAGYGLWLGFSKPAEESPQKRLAVFRFSDNELLLETDRGFSEFLKQSGAIKKYHLAVDSKSAQNEFSMAQSILQDIVRQDYDYLVTFSTPALQVAAQVNAAIPHVFGAVTDPYRMGVATSPADHLPQLTGVATFQPVRTLIQTMRELFPQARRIGIVWNPAEACSEACTLKAREAAREFNFELIEATVSSTSEVLDAVRMVINKKIDLFITSGDNTVILAGDMIAAALHRARIPYCTNAPADIDGGAFLSVGADYKEVGRETAKLALRVIAGEKPEDIPIQDCVPEKMALNRGLARDYGIKLSEAVLKRADRVKD